MHFEKEFRSLNRKLILRDEYSDSFKLLYVISVIFMFTAFGERK